MTNHRAARLTLIPALFGVLMAGAAGPTEVDAADTAMLNAVKCAVRSSSTPPPVNAMQIIGSQDTSARALYDRHDLLLVNAGTGRDLHVGQQFFIRRPAAFGPKQSGPRAVATAGWLRIVAVNETTAIARVEYACEAIQQGDYLDAYVEPVIPAGIDRTDATGEPDFSSPAHVLFGADERASGAAGDFLVIDRALEPGSRLAVYRQLAIPDLPLTPIGETVVVESDDKTSIIRITRARDYVSSGDLLVLRKKN